MMTAPPYKKELRNFQRATLRVKVEFVPVKPLNNEKNSEMNSALSEEGKRYSGMLASVGLGGVFIESNTLFPVGSELRLCFSIPGEEQRVEATGKVVWICQQPNHVRRRRGMGVQFNRLNEKSFRLIDSYVTSKSRLFRQIKHLLSQERPDMKKINELLTSTYIKDYRNLEELKAKVDEEMATFRLSRKR